MNIIGTDKIRWINITDKVNQVTNEELTRGSCKLLELDIEVETEFNFFASLLTQDLLGLS
jgi:hypothetical protein